MTTAARQTTRSVGFRSLDEEVHLDSVPVTGTIPAWLTGTLVRVTPALMDGGGKSVKHWFDGAAMLNAFGFGEGDVSYGSRFLQTDYLDKARAGKFDFGFATDPCRSLFKRVMSLRDVNRFDNANVNLQELGRRYIAMTETPLPVEFEPKTLATLGKPKWPDKAADGQVTTAHPHYDLAREEMVNYTAHFGPRTAYRVYAAGQVGAERRLIGLLPVKKPGYMHSFGMSERYVILAECPLLVNPLSIPLSTRGFIDNYEWEPERGTRFIVMDRHTGEVQGIHQAEAFFCFHHVNSFERDGELVVDLIAHDDSSIIHMLDLDKLRNDDRRGQTNLRRYRIALDGGGVTREDLAPGISPELPRINYVRNNMRDYRWMYAVANSVDGDWLDQLVKVDVTTSESRVWAEPGCYPGEPVFVERPDGTADDDGVILSVVLDSETERSFLLVLDAASFEEVARAEAPHHIPFGFHGQYFEA
ncbi:MAG TPA: carotenoid oxygenase family protein [Thermoleophilaceae bacterium]|nr:carotenoid oxygenase family protein [Thermoleophilaceae bacterium]